MNMIWTQSQSEKYEKQNEEAKTEKTAYVWRGWYGWRCFILFTDLVTSRTTPSRGCVFSVWEDKLCVASGMTNS